ncbi:MAG TPA: prepilin-type N-terminal cleavage/methylation domain-containing protein [Rubrivivax sp.]|nr:prepilin-type N-terminal cleavage/methylation domain-containing protein [Rubrivivax sp.]
MRPTSGSCRRAEARAAGGFTLLELLLVLALVALLSGLVAPRMWQWVQSARVRAGVDGARAELEALPLRAFSAARRIRIDAEEPLPLPGGWRLELTAPLVFEANGMTAGGRLRIIAGPTLLADWLVEPPAGTVRGARPADGPFSPAAVP